MVQSKKYKLSLIVDPRFSGGTSSAVAREVYALWKLCDLEVVAISSDLFKGTSVHAAIEAACEETQTPITWDPATVTADLIALHNPSFLKFNQILRTRMVCDRLFVVCHENFVRPDGPESFDVAHCLGLISDQTLARQKYLAPISGWNRQCIEAWSAGSPTSWQISPLDWTNICDFPLQPPSTKPQDRRGRHSRPGLEKYPSLTDLQKMFPDTCQSVRILGGDGLSAGSYPAHWDVLPFGAEAVEEFLSSIDFFVYFTHPFWQESFGRVIAEAIAAGKVVITSKSTAATFGDGVVATEPEQVDAIVSHMVAEPKLYQNQVERGQQVLAAFSVEAFQNRFTTLLAKTAPHIATQPKTEQIYDFL